MVTGPFNAGKPTFIQSVSEIDVVSKERKITAQTEKVKEETTVEMDFGGINIDLDLVLNLFGTTGQRRCDFVWDISAEGMPGFVVLLDSTRPETSREVRRVLETFRVFTPLPMLWPRTNRTAWRPGKIGDLSIALRLDSAVKLLLCGNQ